MSVWPYDQPNLQYPIILLTLLLPFSVMDDDILWPFTFSPTNLHVGVVAVDSAIEVKCRVNLSLDLIDDEFLLCSDVVHFFSEG